MRLFIAANCGEQFNHALATQLDAWRHQIRVTWSRPQNWHLTLAFLGEWPADRAAGLQRSLPDVAAAHEEFAAQPGDFGGFPNLKSPRVLFLHFASDGRLEALTADIRRCVDEVWPDGPQDRKAFRAHLTVARIKKPLPASQRGLLSQIQFAPWNAVPILDFRLVKSELRPQGPKYTDLAVFPLAASADATP